MKQHILTAFLLAVIFLPVRYYSFDKYIEKNVTENNVKIQICLDFEDYAHADSLLQINLNKVNLVSAVIKAETYFVAGEYYYAISDVEEARTFYMQSLNLYKIIKGENSAQTSKLYSCFGKYFNFRMILDSAYYFTRKSLETYQRSSDKSTINPGSIFCNYGYALKIYKREVNKDLYRYYDSARYWYNEALKQTDTKFEKAEILHQIGNTYTDVVFQKERDHKVFTAEFITAMTLYNKSLLIWKTHPNQFRLKISNSYYTKALLYHYAYKNDSVKIALRYLDSAVNALQEKSGNNKEDIVPQKMKTMYLKQLVILLSKVCEYREEAGLNKTSGELKEILTSSEISIKAWNELLLRYHSREAHRILNIYSIVPFEYAVFSSLGLFEKTRELHYLEKALVFSDNSKYAGVLKSTKSSAVVSITEVKENLGSDILIEYFNSRKDGVVFILTSNGLNYARYSAAQLRPASKRYMDAIILRQRKEYTSSAAAIYNQLIAPVKRYLKEGNSIKIVPHDESTSIPFEALLDSDQDNGDYRKLDYFFNHYNISYALSARWLKVPDKVHAQTYVAFSPFKASATSMPFTSGVTENIAKRYNGSVYESLKNINIDAEVMQISSHGSFNGSDLNSGFSIDTSNSDIISISEIQNMKLDCRLCVVLSCESNKGNFEAGEGIVNFPRMLIRSGTFNSISTFWKVDDKASAKILDKFYTATEEKNISNALTLAKKEYIGEALTSDECHPYYWAGLVYFGANEKLDLNRSLINENYWWLSIFILPMAYIIRRFVKRRV